MGIIVSCNLQKQNSLKFFFATCGMLSMSAMIDSTRLGGVAHKPNRDCEVDKYSRWITVDKNVCSVRSKHFESGY